MQWTANRPKSADVIVVGAGTSGAVVAARLSERPSRRVLLLEAGGSSQPPPHRVLDAATLPGAGDDWLWRVPASIRLAGGATREVGLVRGALVGGSSAVNAASFIRGTAADFDRWAEVAGEQWSATRVLESFMRSENDLDLGGRPVHGDAGPVPVQRGSLEHCDEVTASFYAACAEAGHPLEYDKNGGAEPGYGPVPRNVVDGVRVSTAEAYLRPVADRPNLVVRPHSPVARVVIRNGHTVGVDVVTESGTQFIESSSVVVCAGAIGTASLLLRSGIGPAAALRRIGIDVVLDAPGVGTRCTDHAAVDLPFVPQDRTDRGGAIIDGALHGAIEIGGRSVPYEVLAVRRSYGRASGDDPDDVTLSLRLSPMASRSIGSVELGAVDSVPLVDIDVLSDRGDRAVWRSLVRHGVGLLRSRSMRGVVAEDGAPNTAELDDDDSLDRYVAQHLTMSMHLSSSVPMGSADDPTAVLDGRCAVRGVDGLTVADTSVMPQITTRGPAATAVMIGEHVAAMLDAVVGAGGQPSDSDMSSP